MYTPASDIVETIQSLNFSEFNIDPVLEVLSYYYITPVEIISAANATSGRRIALRCRDPLGKETTFFMGVDKYRQVFSDTHPQRIRQEHKPYFMFFGYGYFNSEAIFVDGLSIEKEDYLQKNFLGYIRRRKRVNKEGVKQMFPDLSLKELDARAYEHDGHIYYIPSFATQEETMLLHGQMDVPPYSRYKILNARNQWSAYLYANPEAGRLYTGEVTSDELIIRPSRPMVLSPGETFEPGPSPIPQPLRTLDRFSISIESNDAKFYARMLSDLLANFDYSSFELVFSHQDSALTNEIIKAAGDLLRARSKSISIEYDGSYTMIDKRHYVAFLVKVPTAKPEQSSSPR